MNNINDIANVIARRDEISFNEAMEAINNCIDELREIQTLEEAEDCIAFWLGLEPDVLDILLNL